jgi:hypothetical protein
MGRTHLVGHTTAIPQQHTPTRMDTIHSPTSHCSRSHNQRTTMINEHDDEQSSFNDQSINNE